jgi:hypothetical protein
MTARTGGLVTVADTRFGSFSRASFSSLVGPDTVYFSSFSRASFASLANVNAPAFYPFSQNRQGAWSRTFLSGFLPDLETPMSVVQVLQSTATTLSVFMREASTGLGLTGIAPSAFTIQIKKSNLSVFSLITPTVTETGLGWYDLALTASHTNTYGKTPLEIAATGALTRDDIMLDVIALNQFTDPVRAGLTALPNANAGATGGLPLVGTQIPLAAAGANTGLPVIGTQVPLAAAGAAGGLPLVGTQIPLATAGLTGGLPLVGTQIPLAAAGANTGLPVVGNQIPNAAAGTNDGLPLAEQITNIAVTGAALNIIAISRTITTGTEIGVLSNTDALDGVFHTFTDVAGAIDFFYQFDISAIPNSVGVSVQWKGYLNTSGNTIKVYAWDWFSSAWDQIGTIAGSGDTVVYTADLALTNSYTSAGIVRIRFSNTGLTTATLATDRLLLGYTVLPMTATQVANAVLDDLMTSHSTGGSIGEGIAIASGMLQGNFYMDNVVNTNPNGQTSARIRLFRTGIATAAATPGGIGEGEFATFLITTTYTGPNKIAVHKVVKQ